MSSSCDLYGTASFQNCFSSLPRNCIWHLIVFGYRVFINSRNLESLSNMSQKILWTEQRNTYLKLLHLKLRRMNIPHILFSLMFIWAKKHRLINCLTSFFPNYFVHPNFYFTEIPLGIIFISPNYCPNYYSTEVLYFINLIFPNSNFFVQSLTLYIGQTKNCICMRRSCCNFAEIYLKNEPKDINRHY